MEGKTMTNLTRTLVLTALALGLGTTGAFAQQAITATASPASAGQDLALTASAHATTPADAAAIKAGDRNCIRDTGTHIRAKTGDCLPVVGRSYSGAELRSTGQIDTGRALQMLDPSIRIGQ